MKDFLQIWDCEDVLEFQCPQKWDLLTETNTEDIRHCNFCSKNVFMSSTPQEFIQNAKAGNCVAIPNQVAHRPTDPVWFVGQPSPEKVREQEQQLRLISEFMIWWKAILISDPSFFSIFIRKCYEESYLDNHVKQFAFEILEFEQFDRVIEIAKSQYKSEGFLRSLVEKIVGMERLDIALEVAAVFGENNYKAIALNCIALKFAELGQLEKAANVFEMSLQTARSLPRSSQKYEAEVLRLAASVNITLHTV